jgi:hypothetical protein
MTSWAQQNIIVRISTIFVVLVRQMYFCFLIGPTTLNANSRFVPSLRSNILVHGSIPNFFLFGFTSPSFTHSVLSYLRKMSTLQSLTNFISNTLGYNDSFSLYSQGNPSTTMRTKKFTNTYVFVQTSITISSVDFRHGHIIAHRLITA